MSTLRSARGSRAIRCARSSRSGAFELFHGRLRGLTRTHVQVHTRPHTADAVARALANLVVGLSPAARRCWDRARVRDFNIGIQSGAVRRVLELPLSAATVSAIAEVGRRVVVTMYAASKRRGASNS